MHLGFSWDESRSQSKDTYHAAWFKVSLCACLLSFCNFLWVCLFTFTHVLSWTDMCLLRGGEAGVCSSYLLRCMPSEISIIPQSESLARQPSRGKPIQSKGGNFHTGASPVWFKETHYAETQNREPLCYRNIRLTAFHNVSCHVTSPLHSSDFCFFTIEIIPLAETTYPSLWDPIQLVRTPFQELIWWWII